MTMVFWISGFLVCAGGCALFIQYRYCKRRNLPVSDVDGNQWAFVVCISKLGFDQGGQLYSKQLGSIS